MRIFFASLGICETHIGVHHVGSSNKMHENVQQEESGEKPYSLYTLHKPMGAWRICCRKVVLRLTHNNDKTTTNSYKNVYNLQCWSIRLYTSLGFYTVKKKIILYFLSWKMFHFAWSAWRPRDGSKKFHYSKQGPVDRIFLCREVENECVCVWLRVLSVFILFSFAPALYQTKWFSGGECDLRLALEYKGYRRFWYCRQKRIICQKGVGIINVCFLKTYVFAHLLTWRVYTMREICKIIRNETSSNKNFFSP